MTPKCATARCASCASSNPVMSLWIGFVWSYQTPPKTFDGLWAELAEKAASRPEGSGTVAQLEAGVHAIGKKLVEEAAESWMAAEYESRQRAAEEISQLFYQAQVLMLALDLKLEDVYRHL